ncbi:MAG: hypothetical protein KME10_28805 [Plectolyngbya sp. WJT66-NPBG17]|nr:hypothetical protein [Plectolyngbya sp. WJT66-NPBG17]
MLIKDGNGKLIATGSLGKGSLAELGSDPACVFSVAVENIPSSDFYTIEIGNRKGMTYCKEEMQQKKWRLELSLG